MFVTLLLLTQIIFIAAQIYNKPLLNQPSSNYSQNLWHSYVFNTGGGNREGLNFLEVKLLENFASADDVHSWKSLQVDESIVIVGLGQNFLLVTSFNGTNNHTIFKEGIHGAADSFILFERWNARSQEIERFVIVAVETHVEYFILRWYFIKNGKLEFLWDWPYYKTITYIDTIKVHYELKLLIVSYENASSKSFTADIYSFKVNSYLDIWLFEKIILEDNPSSFSVFNINENSFLSVSFPTINTVHIFRYSPPSCLESPEEQKHFFLYQKLYSDGLTSLSSFKVGFRQYLAVASKTSVIYKMEDNLTFSPVNLIMGSYNSWLAAPINTYREDVVLLGKSVSNVDIINWIGNEKFQVSGSFMESICQKDSGCLKKMSNVTLKNSTAFNLGRHLYILLSAVNGNPLLFKLLIKLKKIPSLVAIKLNEISETKISLEERYKDQKVLLEELIILQKGLSEKDGISTSREFFVSSNRNLTNGHIQSQTKNWGEVLSIVNVLKSRINTLTHEVKNLKNLTGHTNDQAPTILPRNVSEGITFYGDVLINDLDLSIINGHNFSNLQKDTLRKNQMKKIEGTKIIKNLNAENLLFTKINGARACDIVFSDDLWEANVENVSNGDLKWEGKLSILGDLQLFNDSSTSAPYKFKHFDQVNLQELKILEKSDIQGSINGQPFILPVHNSHLDIHYFDFVINARVELIHIKNDLNVDFINGKNFSSLFENKLPQQRMLNSVKIDGILSSHLLEAQLINGFDVNANKFNSFEVKAENNYLNHTYSKTARSVNLKRIIHVFQNVDVHGNLLTKKINNTTWSLLNDILRKDEPKVFSSGVKSFVQPLKTKNFTLDGTFNGRFLHTVFTNYSDQELKFPVLFDQVKFKNVVLSGQWDGIYPNILNQSVTWSHIENAYIGNLTFGDNCLIFTEGLNITDSANHVSFLKSEGRKKDITGNLKLGFLKASKISLYGSLLTHGNLNNINLTNFYWQRITQQSPQKIDLEFSRDDLTLNGNINVVNFNNNDVLSIISTGGDTKLIDNFLSGDIKKIKKLLVNGNVTTIHGFNHLNLSTIIKNGICIKKPIIIKGNITFENIIYLNNINVTDSIDGVPLKKFEKDIVFKHSHVFLSGVKNFSTVKVTKDVKSRAIKGHLIQDIVTMKGDQSIKGPVIVNGKVIVLGNLTSYGMINCAPVNEIQKKFSIQFNSFIYGEDLKLFNDSVAVDYLMVDGNIQNKSFDVLLSKAVFKSSPNKVLGKKTLKGKLKFGKNVFVEGKIGKTNLSELFEDLVFINKLEKIEGMITIKEAVLKELETTGNFNSRLINNFNMRNWFEESIPLDKYEIVSGKKKFENAHVWHEVKVDVINGHLPSALVTLKGKQYIPALALFPRILVNSDLSVGGFVNEKNLLNEYQDSLLLSGVQTMEKKTVFIEKFIVNGTLFVNTINGKRIANLVTLGTEQLIKSPLQFFGLVTAFQGIEELKAIGDVDLEKWNRSAVSFNRQQALKGLWMVKGKVKANNIEGKGLLDSANLLNLSKAIVETRGEALQLRNKTESELATQCIAVNTISQHLLKTPYIFRQFEFVHEVETFKTIGSVINFMIKDTNYLLVTFVNECESFLYKWNKHNSTFTHFQNITIGPVNKWLVAYQNGATYIITSSLKSTTSCEGNLQKGNIWLIEGDSDNYIHLLTTNGFVDVVQKNKTSGQFFTLENDGALFQWTIEDRNISSKLITKIGQGNYKFVDFKITGDLAVTNGKEIKQIKTSDDGKSKQFNISLPNPNIVALPLNGKTLVALVVRDKIVIYDNLIEEREFSVLNIFRAGSVLWLNYGSEKQAFLIIGSHQRLIEVYEYKGVSGMVKKMSIQMFSSSLQSLNLPSGSESQISKFIAVIQKKKIIFLKADMTGGYYQDNLRCYPG